MATNEFANRWAGPGATTALATARPKPTILIAEDNADSREMFQLLLESKGYETVCAEDGPHALEVAVQSLPDLLLIDLEMPRIDGLTIAKNLRAHPQLKEVPIIIVSGHDPEKYRQAALEAGCNDYLRKPINFDRLDEILDTLVPNDSVSVKRRGRSQVIFAFKLAVRRIQIDNRHRRSPTNSR